MALIAKASSAVATQGLAQSRALTPVRPQTSIGNGPVEGLNNTVGTELDQAVTKFPDQEYYRPQDRRDNSQTRDQFPGPPRAVVRTPTEAFAALIEFGDTLENEFERAPKADTRASIASYSKAINTYEGNERVIFGTEDTPGKRLSISL